MPKPPHTAPAVQMEHITKAFPGVVANDDISFEVQPQTIHAVIGENGAGKSTLMGILYGRFRPDKGAIRIHGKDVRIDRPADAISLGIGMVTQHTTMVPALTVFENLILGAEPAKAGVIDWTTARAKVADLSRELGIQVELAAAAGSLSVAALQKAEILKALFRGANILILDEPTATLGPTEADSLFRLLHRLRESGSTIIFITHKLREVMANASRTTVLRGGRCVGDRAIAETDPDELLSLMIGNRTSAATLLLGRDAEKVGEHHGPKGATTDTTTEALSSAPPALEVSNVSAAGRRGSTAVRDITLMVMPGEVIGIAGVDGSGQRELAEVVVGLRHVAAGSIRLAGRDVSSLGTAERLRAGVTFVPEDRHRQGLILDFTLAENLMLGRARDRRFGGGRTLNLRTIARRAGDIIRESRVIAPNAGVLARSLSGGNQQKVVIARALAGEPRLLVAMQPTRGLDAEATRFVYERLEAAKSRGLAVLLFSLDLDEIFAVSDRIAVLFDGRLMGIVPRSEATTERVGQMMVGHEADAA